MTDKEDLLGRLAEMTAVSLPGEAQKVGLNAAVESMLSLGQTAMGMMGVLPVKHLTENGRAALEAAGVVFGAPTDRFFEEAQLPAGWSLKLTASPLWSTIVDDKGRPRARVFYNAAFWDRDAHIRVIPRYSLRNDPDDEVKKFRFSVYDGDRPIWSTQWMEFLDYNKEPSAETMLAYEKARTALETEAKVFLANGWPNFADITAYWE